MKDFKKSFKYLEFKSKSDRLQCRFGKINLNNYLTPDANVFEAVFYGFGLNYFDINKIKI